MTEPVIPSGSLRDLTVAPRIEHELISFAVFLDYRARRMRAPVTDTPNPEVPTTAPDSVPPKS